MANMRQTLDKAASAGSTRRPRAVLWAAIGLVVLWLAVGGVGGPLVGKLSQVAKNDNASFVPASAESTEVANVVARFTDRSQIPFLVVVERTDGAPLEAANLAALQTFASGIPALPLTAIGADASVADYLPDGTKVVPVPSQDGKAALLVLPLDADRASTTVGKTNALLETAAVLRSESPTALGAGLVARVGGPGGLISDFGAAFKGIDGILLVVTLCVVLVILLLVYRSPVLPVVVLVSAIFGLALAALAVYPLAKGGHIKLSGQSQGIMSILVIGAATDYALLLVSRFREELHDDPNAWVAVRRAWRGTVEPILASGVTVILGLLCLLFASLGSTTGLGPVGAFGIAGALFSSLTFLPAMLLLLGRRAFWPFVPKVDHVHSQDKVGTRSLWGRVATLVGTHPRRIWVVTLGLLLVGCAFAPTLKADGVSTSEVFRTQVDSVLAQKAIERHFPAGAGQPIQVVAPEAKADAVLAALTDDPGVDTAYIGLTPPVPGRPAAPPPVRDGQVLVQAVLKDAADSRAAEASVERLRTSLDAVSTDALVGGTTATNLDVRSASARDLKVIVPIVLVLIFLVLCLLLRSVVAPLLLVGANILSFGATIGAAALVFNHVLDLPGADPSIPLYGFVFLIALGIDYSIFLMTRVREESFVRGTRPGTLVGLAVTGGVITSAGIVLASTFSALVVLPLVFMVQIAFIVAFGVLVDTFVVRSLLVPALSHDLGARVWWPARRPGEGPSTPVASA